ncbi:MAG TPA: OmpA family protein [Kofleriaceae bacterium]|jgi:peptidoglycan-associated lipoprotein
MSRPSGGKVTPIIIAAIAMLIGSIATTSCGDKPKAPGCKADKDCKDGLKCSENKCVECVADGDCAKGQKCSANACVAAAECEKDDQCPTGQVCQAGKCKPCASDSDCGPGGSCSSGTCNRGKKCGSDTDCADDEDCVNGYCQKAGTSSNDPNACPLATVYFGFDDSSVQASERDRLDQNASCIEKAKTKSVYLIGHTDTSGTEEYNIALSERRAQSVADYLARLGSDPARMQVVPKGETEPTGLGDDKDRRVEFQWK